MMHLIHTGVIKSKFGNWVFVHNTSTEELDTIDEVFKPDITQEEFVGLCIKMQHQKQGVLLRFGHTITCPDITVSDGAAVKLSTRFCYSHSFTNQFTYGETLRLDGIVKQEQDKTRQD